jgi:hypothetical protein
MSPRAPREFICADCGSPVVVIVPVHDNDQDVCSTCSWLRSIEDPEERAHLRTFLKAVGAISDATY